MNRTLPEWIARLLGIDASPGEGAVWSLQHQWAWPPWATLLFVAAAAALVVWLYLREAGHARRRYRLLLAGFRLGLVGILLLMIAQGSLSLKRTGLPSAALLVDDSRSMTVVDRYGKDVGKPLRRRVGAVLGEDARLSRWNLARTLLAENGGELVEALASDYQLRTYFLSETQTGTDGAGKRSIDQLQQWTPEAESSRLGAAVRMVLDDLRGTAPAAIILLSDGINTDGPTLAEATEVARQRGVPLFTVGLGSAEPARDLRLTDLLVDPVVFAGDVVHFRIRVGSSGFQGRTASVTLREQGAEEVLATTDVTIGPNGQPQEVHLPYRIAEEGLFHYQIEIEPQPEEQQLANNRQEATVEARRQTIRVLLAQAYPNFEFRYLRNLLVRDETIELDTVLQEADPEHAAQDASALAVFPVRREELFAYDVIILGDLNPGLLSRSIFEHLADFVDQPRKGGGLVLIAGPKYMPAAFRDTPLARVMPLELDSVRYPAPDEPIAQGFQVQPTELGLSSPMMQLGDTPAETEAIWQGLAPLYWLLEVPDLKPAARVLAEHPFRLGHHGRPLPVMFLHYVGSGKVVFHATDETWRWRRRVGDVHFARYWVQLIRYLARSQLTGSDGTASLVADRREYARGESVRLRLRFHDERLAPEADDGATVVVEQQGGKSRRVRLGRGPIRRGVFEGIVADLPEGDYHAWMAIPTLDAPAPAVDFVVRPPPGEMEQIRMDADALRAAAERSAGRYYDVWSADRLADNLPPGRQVPIQALPPWPLWNRWPVLALFVGLLIGEWILRKRAAMV